MPLKPHFLLIAVAICALLHLESRRARRIAPADPGVSFVAEGTFPPDGQYPGEPFGHAIGVRAWGSWGGSDANTGRFTLGPFVAPPILRFGISGYPDNPGNSVRVELADGSGRLAIPHGAVGERWRIVDFLLPREWAGRPIQLVGVDDSKVLGGWFAITEPIRGGRGDGTNGLIETLAAWGINGLLLGLAWIAAAQWLSRGAPEHGSPELLNHPPVAVAGYPPRWRFPAAPALAPQWVPLVAGAVVAAGGYLAFWAYWLHAGLGVVFSWALLATAGVGAVGRGTRWTWGNRSRQPAGPAGRVEPAQGPGRHLRPGVPQEMSTVLILCLTVGAFHLALLHLFPSSQDFYTLAANRFREALPGDNVLPHTLAERLYNSAPLRHQPDEWLSSDRPPLQSGWILLTWPVGRALGLDKRTASGTAAVWFQLLWVAAAYGLLRTFAVERARAAGWVAALALAGFFLQNTTFTWPKLSAGALACGAFAILLRPETAALAAHARTGPGWDGRAPARGARADALWAGALAALAWLSHGGVAFSFLALLPFVLWRARHGAWRAWGPGAAVALALALPWLVYQKVYDPPANRLFKWHLAGQTAPDARGTWETIRDSYARIGSREAWQNKLTNFHAQVFGDWGHLIDVSPATAVERRNQEFFYTGRALTWWPFLALLALVVTRRRVLKPSHDLELLGGWLTLTIIVWCLLMFGAYQAVIHHGSYALMIGLFVLFSVLLERGGRGWLPVIAVAQAVTLGTTWAIGTTSIRGPATGLPFVIAGAAVLGWLMLRAHLEAPMLATDPLPPGRDQHNALLAGGRFSWTMAKWRAWGQTPRAQVLRAWWQAPHLNLALLAIFAALLLLRKPHTLLTPQLWAEDGSIFMMQADSHGAAALAIPYMGYLHTLPRLIAGTASNLFDPAWWPAFYNGVSVAIWLAVLLRMFTARFDLPGKPWLALAFMVVPHSGEVFFNVTNLQWITAFVLIQQAFIAPPKTSGERISDLAILALVALTGPFGVIFLPLLTWRAWRDRSADSVLAFAVVGACAALQVWFLVRTGPRFEFQSDPFQLWPNAVVLARRLIVWPALGSDLALRLPPAAIMAIGGTLLVALLAWVARPHPRRLWRLQVVAALGLITLAAIYRTRPDRWASDNLEYGDRYFYIPRVLVAWLLIWEFDTVPRAIARAARAFCLLVVTVQLRHYILPSPPDYRWAAQVESIRRGVPALIPTLPEGWIVEYHGRPAKKP